ncbi:FAD/NAD(P)-binding domain-containing protein [Lepidopterella palustris CBS 459.81]|uniref:FAD/NAD(P)-binding domain-containing protein n=1 Tax=Lepidopterella palustris CBS 459.81 TaxID=1314670 RepID=A0A8E2DXF6_9PEZI|nr:FAD/NAD(P)-binding domain-containing protein [Lepidopterella palustris CBS 459.81]
MHRTFAWLLVSSVFVSGVYAWPAKSHPPVCIVGAGPSGLIAASELQKKGYETVIFEKQPEIGGKCQTHYENGNAYPMGAAFYSIASYPETLKVINVSGVSSTPFALAGSREEFTFNWTTGATQRVPPVSNQFIQALTAEIPRYVSIWQQVFAPISVPGYKNGVPDELTVSTVEWFSKNGFNALPILVVDPLALYGYGDIRIVPILYTLQYLTPDVLTAFTGVHTAYFTDFHKVWVRWARKSVKGPIYTGAEVNCIVRSGSQPIIKYTKKDVYHSREHQQICSSVIVAFPPTLDNLDKAGLDLTNSEKEVFAAVGVHNYFSAVVEFNLPYGVSYIGSSSSPAVPPPNDGEPVAVLQLFPTSQIATSWSWGPYRQFESKWEARDLLKTTLSKINKDPTNATAMSVPVSEKDIRTFRKWDYFPHFDSPELKNGWYGKFNALQGKDKTFWTSGLNGMETVEWAIRAGQDIVHSYF